MSAAITASEIRLVFKQAKNQALTVEDLKDRLNATTQDELQCLYRFLFAASARGELKKEMVEGRFEYTANKDHVPSQSPPNATADDLRAKPSATTKPEPAIVEKPDGTLTFSSQTPTAKLPDEDLPIVFDPALMKASKILPPHSSFSEQVSQTSISEYLQESFNRADAALKAFLDQIADQQVLGLLMDARDEARFAIDSYDLIQRTRELVGSEKGGAA